MSVYLSLLPIVFIMVAKIWALFRFSFIEPHQSNQTERPLNHAMNTGQGTLFTSYIACDSQEVTIFLSIPLFFGPASKSHSKSVTIHDLHSM